MKQTVEYGIREYGTEDVWWGSSDRETVERECRAAGWILIARDVSETRELSVE